MILRTMDAGLAGCSGQHWVHARSTLSSVVQVVRRSVAAQAQHRFLRQHPVRECARSRRSCHKLAKAAAADIDTDIDEGQASASGKYLLSGQSNAGHLSL